MGVNVLWVQSAPAASSPGKLEQVSRSKLCEYPCIASTALVAQIALSDLLQVDLLIFTCNAGTGLQADCGALG